MSQNEEEPEILIQHLKFVVKKGYHPAYVFIERWRPRVRDWEILDKLSVNQKLVNKLNQLIREIETVI